MTDLSRREFGALVAASAVAGRAADAQAVTANDVVDRIVKNAGVSWRFATLDGVKAGDASTVVTGVATTAMATLRVLQQAVKAGANFVVTCDVTAFNAVQAALEAAGIKAESAEIEQVPKASVDVDVETGKKIAKLLDALDEHEDVSTVFCNANLTPEMWEYE